MANEDAEKEAAAREMQRQIAEHRADCFRRRETEARENRMRELEMTRVRKEADELFRKNEAERRNKVFEKNKDVAAYHLKQAVSGQAELFSQSGATYCAEINDVILCESLMQRNAIGVFR